MSLTISAMKLQFIRVIISAMERIRNEATMLFFINKTKYKRRSFFYRSELREQMKSETNGHVAWDCCEEQSILRYGIAANYFLTMTML